MLIKPTTTLPKIKEMVEEYKDLKIALGNEDQIYAKVTDPIKIRMADLKQAIIKSFTKIGLPSIRTSDDYLCSYKKETEVVVTNEIFAYKWALDNRAVRIDKRIADQIIREMKEVPEGFEKVEKETILLTNKKKKEEHE